MSSSSTDHNCPLSVSSIQSPSNGCAATSPAQRTRRTTGNHDHRGTITSLLLPTQRNAWFGPLRRRSPKALVRRLPRDEWTQGGVDYAQRLRVDKRDSLAPTLHC